MRHSNGFYAAAIGAAAAVGLSSSALAAKPSESAWVASPTDADWITASSEVLKSAGFFRAVARCAVETSGELSNCRIISETPRGLGGGQALLNLAPKFRRKPPGDKDPRQADITIGGSNFDKPGDWLRRPTETDLRTVFPAEAFRRGISGSATISCVATVQGALTDCVTADEYPVDMGFGSAAIALTPQFLMKPATLRGVPVPSIMRIPINFKLFGPTPVADSKRVAPPNLAWTEAPSYADVVAAYPSKARQQRVGGRATLACTMTREGRLSNCDTVTSDPKNFGFESAAKTLAKMFRLEVTTPKDAAAARDLMVHLPVTFDPAMLDQANPVVGKPNWAKLPESGQVLTAFEALKATGTVRVQLSCLVKPAGYVDQCRVVSEQPGTLGAGAAALSLTPSFRLTTWTAEGLPTVGATVTIPIRYEPDTTPKSSSPPAGH